LIRVRWLVFALLFAFAFTGYVQRTSVAIAAERIMPELGLTQTQVGWLFTAFLFTYSAFQVPGALVGRRFGPRRTLTGVGVVTFVASVVTVAAPSLAAGAALFMALLAARSLLGIAQAALFPVASGVIERWFPVRSWATAQGLIVTGLWAGSAATPPLVATLMHHSGWRGALLAVSIPSLLVVGLWQIFARDRPADHSAVRPAELEELAANPVAAPGDPLTRERLLRVLADPQILRITASYFVMNYVFYLVTFWSFLYLVQFRRMSVLTSGWLASLPFLVAGAASAAGGRIADRLRARFGDRVGLRILPLAGLPSAAVFLYLTVRVESAGWAVAALCLGFAGIEITEASFWGATMRLAPSDTMAATALLNTGGNLGGVIATPIIASLSASHDWPAVFATGAATALLAAALWFTIDASRSSSHGEMT
jgi:ACS family glucarate transporter-like MFS transporter